MPQRIETFTHHLCATRCVGHFGKLIWVFVHLRARFNVCYGDILGVSDSTESLVLLNEQSAINSLASCYTRTAFTIALYTKVAYPKDTFGLKLVFRHNHYRVLGGTKGRCASCNVSLYCLCFHRYLKSLEICLPNFARRSGGWTERET